MTRRQPSSAPGKRSGRSWPGSASCFVSRGSPRASAKHGRSLRHAVVVIPFTIAYLPSRPGRADLTPNGEASRIERWSVRCHRGGMPDLNPYRSLHRGAGLAAIAIGLSYLVITGFYVASGALPDGVE